MLIERLGLLSLCIDYKRIRGDLLSGLKAPRNRATNQEPPKPMTVMRRMRSQTSHAEARHRITR